MKYILVIVSLTLTFIITLTLTWVYTMTMNMTMTMTYLEVESVDVPDDAGDHDLDLLLRRPKIPDELKYLIKTNKDFIIYQKLQNQKYSFHDNKKKNPWKTLSLSLLYIRYL